MGPHGRLYADGGQTRRAGDDPPAVFSGPIALLGGASGVLELVLGAPATALARLRRGPRLCRYLPEHLEQAALLLLLGESGRMAVGAGGAPLGAVAAIMIGAVVCCAAAVGGDNLQDLKAGYIVGATPWKQQVALIIGVLFGSLIIPPVLNLMQRAFGFLGAPGAGDHALAAPQADDAADA